MPSRMDRHETITASSRRLSKNKQLYEDLYTNTSYTEFNNLKSSNIVDLTQQDSEFSSRREEYQRTRKFSSALGTEDKLEKRHYDTYQKHQFIDEKDKDYDINLVLENAKKNRNEIDELEKKRKLRATEYDILSDLTQEKLKENKEKKKEVLTKQEEEELEELIHTITSKTMRQEIDDELLGDLMPSKLEDTIVTDAVDGNYEQNDEENHSNDEKKESEDEEFDTSKIDDSFFTKSMELTKSDLLSLDEGYGAYYGKSSKKDAFIKILLTIGIVAMIVIIGIIICNSVF